MGSRCGDRRGSGHAVLKSHLSNGASAVHRPTVLIISDNTEFSHAVARHWQGQRNSPALTLKESDFCGQPPGQTFDLAILGGLAPDVLCPVLPALKVSRN